MTQNPMRKISVEKITLNIGAGKDENTLKKGIKLITQLTGKEPIKTLARKRIPTWGLRPGLPIGCKLTLRGKDAVDMMVRMLKAKENILNEKQFDNNGNFSFGVSEHIDISGAKYDPEIGIMGVEIAITLKRPGFRIKSRKLKIKSVGKAHRITKEEAMNFMKENFKVQIGE